MSKKKPECATCDTPAHPDHRDQLSRLNRIGGQVEGIKKMIEARRYCPGILIQLRAIRAALQTVEGHLLHRHLNQCVAEVFRSGNAAEREKKINELQELYRRFGE